MTTRKAYKLMLGEYRKSEKLYEIYLELSGGHPDSQDYYFAFSGAVKKVDRFIDACPILAKALESYLNRDLDRLAGGAWAEFQARSEWWENWERDKNAVKLLDWGKYRKAIGWYIYKYRGDELRRFVVLAGDWV